MEKEIAPIMTEYWEKAEFPFHAIPKLATLGLAGGTTKGYGCLGLSLTASAISTAEVARVDASCSTFILVHASLVVPTIGKSIVSLPFILYVPWDAQEQLLCTPKLSVSIFIFFFVKHRPLCVRGSKAEVLTISCSV